MSEEIVCSLVEVYNRLTFGKLTLTMTQSVAVALAYIFDEGGGISMRTALYKIFDSVTRENSPDTLITLPLRFYRNEIFFYYFVLAKQTETGVHIEILSKDERLQERLSGLL
jgi:hypothetical protein